MSHPDYMEKVHSTSALREGRTHRADEVACRWVKRYVKNMNDVAEKDPKIEILELP